MSTAPVSWASAEFGRLNSEFADRLASLPWCTPPVILDAEAALA